MGTTFVEYLNSEGAVCRLLILMAKTLAVKVQKVWHNIRCSCTVMSQLNPCSQLN